MLFRGCSTTMAALLHPAYIRPILEFAGPAWFPTSHRSVFKVERQDWGYKINRPSYQDRLKIMGINTFGERRRREPSERVKLFLDRFTASLQTEPTRTFERPSLEVVRREFQNLMTTTVFVRKSLGGVEWAVPGGYFIDGCGRFQN